MATNERAYERWLVAEVEERKAREATDGPEWLNELIDAGAPAADHSDGMAEISLKMAAERLGVRPVTLRMAIRRNRMSARKLGRDWLVEESEVAWYEMRSRGRVGRPRKTRA